MWKNKFFPSRPELDHSKVQRVRTCSSASLCSNMGCIVYMELMLNFNPEGGNECLVDPENH